uniref:solute carrier family 22 member 22-like isoform X1 n=3 Tax=Myodes glareolus TaxID=447135 RepID=UPI00201FBE3D|nr:solute carrier family 22 member 22-like isoform X1 [Myodes glareolus]XP_048313214.1 solute carrier family 22 member 22-like isoform X1 [Myodes glareolus]
MAVDEILQHVGDRGRFQILRVVLYIILSLLSSPHDIMENFTAAIPNHHCNVKLLDNHRSEINITMNLTTEALLKVSIPMGPDQKPEKCRRFRHTQWHFLDSNVSVLNNTELETEPCLDGWTYDQSVFTSTIVTEWDLVCDFRSFKYYAQAIAIAGHLVSGLVGGIFSDRFGRKPLLAYSCLAYGILGICCAFAPSFFLYCALRFLLSASISNIVNNCTILVLEETTPQWHGTIIVLGGLFFSIGQSCLGGLAYLLSDWHMLQLAYALPHFIFFIVFCWAPESVRWLMTTGKTEQAIKDLQKIAFINGKKDIAHNLTTEAMQSKLKEDRNSTSKHFRIKDIIINPTMRKILICNSSVMFAALFSGYGILLDIQVLGKNIFMNLILLGVTDIPSKLITYFIIRNVRRRPSVAFTLLTIGSCIAITIFIPEDMYVLRLVLFLLGKGSFASFTCLAIAYTQELTPTVLRSTLIGVYNIAARIAAILSALALVTRKYFVHLPLILCGILPVVATINIYFLPETLNFPLMDTIKDLEKRFVKKSVSKKEEQDFLETTEC